MLTLTMYTTKGLQFLGDFIPLTPSKALSPDPTGDFHP